ncbi:hypothetical protein CAI21_04455 [Alkalilimnicola ehrlichii]|uniref:Uncharacterized protein n=1 Tax=Alkalilimnicola ehrlichii TaxID=351052 RepID=A0A3E0X1Z3_9GAMM|nr:VPLPA-CTERM sorting domain-containing protein [Alkalilimnicola ehrlichii]RFA30766.1 hypothetical protein CAI21_04455 [Alkalilimnicola ehrlichii]RFA38342.1 hypothetical protein CAL65_05820 [Alkalilimnicola ehrlichii]
MLALQHDIRHRGQPQLSVASRERRGQRVGSTKTRLSIIPFGWVTDGNLVWDTQPGAIESELGVFSVFFEEINGITPGKLVTVRATITDVTPVPLPAAAWLFGSALLAFGGIRLRQRRRQAIAA